MPQENVWIHGSAALVSACLLILLGIRRIIRSDRSIWVYGVAFMAGLTGVYLRFLWVGSAPFGLWDTTALMGAAYCLFMFQRFSMSEKISVPLYRLTLLIPILAIMTMPLGWASAPGAGVLMAAGALYLSLRYTTGNSLPLYMGVLTINAAIYLWIPSWFGKYNLM
ncbi:MAG: hypothetical protein GY795_02135, partial [Desulfobacterales bacterium]|nr:hypothetical protein [Desulfobacterales bacterium]